MEISEKLAHMEEWWETDTGNICKEKLSHDNFRDIAESCGINFRKGIHDLLDFKRKNDMPMLVVSAGVGELIKAWFEIVTEERGSNIDELKPFGIVSNLGIFENNELIKFNLPLVHIMNKAKHVKKFVDDQIELDAQHHHHLRSNIIVMGDIIEDLQMISDIKWDNIIKIGFLNNMDIDSHLEEEYVKAFDIVILHDGNLWPVTALLELFKDRKITWKDKLPQEFSEFLCQFEKEE